MIGYLSGQVKNIFEDRIILNVNNVGYEVRLPLSSILMLKSEQGVELLIHTHVREDQITLFGFFEKSELEIFKKLLSVSGVGPKSALATLSVATPSTIYRSISAGNADLFPKVPGVGKKTIEKIIIELKNSISYESFEDETESIRDARLALETLGYNSKDISTVLAKLDKDKNMNDLIREALQILSKTK